MGQVTVRVNGYAHTIGCKDGEEAHVYELVNALQEEIVLAVYAKLLQRHPGGPGA